MSAAQRVFEGAFEMVAITGPSGTGKSAHVNQLIAVARSSGFFITGKFDQFERAQPYSALLQACNDFCTYVLMQDEPSISKMRSIILKALGDEGKVLTDVISKLHSIIGDQPDVPEIEEHAKRMRFNYVFQKLLKAICSSCHPVIIFIDDMHWADLDSLDLLSTLVADKEIKYLLVVGTFRSDEVNESHPLTSTLHEISTKVRLNIIELGNLLPEDVNDLLSDALSMPKEETASLTTLVFQKTLGNPFFVIEFLTSLHLEKLLYFCLNKKQWVWKMDEINAKNITVNVAELVLSRVIRLPSRTQNILKLASCLGDNFDLLTLALLSNDNVTVHLERAFCEGIIILTNYETKTFRFSHDMLQKAVYSLIPEEEKNSMHVSIGKKLWKHASGHELDQKLLFIVNLLNSGVNMITDSVDRIGIAELNLEAAIKAQTYGAFKPAAVYCATGISFLPMDCWEVNYELSLKLYTAASENALCLLDLDLMDRMLQEVFTNVQSFPHKLRLYYLKMKAYKTQGKHCELLDLGLNLLRQLGHEIPVNPHNSIQLFVRMKERFTEDAWSKMQLMENEYTESALEILNGMMVSCYALQRDNLLIYLTYLMVDITLRYGLSKFSASGFACFGFLLCTMGDAKEAYRFGETSLKIAAKFNSKVLMTQLYIPVYGLINIWSKPLRSTIEPLLCGTRVAMEAGAIEDSFVNVQFYFAHALWCGVPLEPLKKEMESHCEFFYEYKSNGRIEILVLIQQLYIMFISRFLALEPSTDMWLDGDVPAKLHEISNKTKEFSGLFNLHQQNTILCYFFHEYEMAYNEAKECRRFIKLATCKFSSGTQVFYEGLISFALLRQECDVPDTESVLDREKNGSNSIAQMRNWCENAPENFSNKLNLLEAEMAFTDGDESKAIYHYNNAIELAKRNGFLHEEALANERAGIFYFESSIMDKASYHLSQACRLYLEWGSEAKVQQLKNFYPQLIQRPDQHLEMEMTTSNCTPAVSEITNFF